METAAHDRRHQPTRHKTAPPLSPRRAVETVSARRSSRERLAAPWPSSFNPLPASMPGESPGWVSLAWFACFNPLPASMPGEYDLDDWRGTGSTARHRCRIHWRRRWLGFNPLPDRSVIRPSFEDVSIRSRHRCRENNGKPHGDRRAQVSIRSRHRCRENAGAWHERT